MRVLACVRVLRTTNVLEACMKWQPACVRVCACIEHCACVVASLHGVNVCVRACVFSSARVLQTPSAPCVLVCMCVCVRACVRACVEQCASVADIPRSMWRLLCNPVYMVLVVGGCCEICIVSGFCVFLPKYLETQFGISKSSANLLTGTCAHALSLLMGTCAHALVSSRVRVRTC